MKSLYRHKQTGDLFAIETDKQGNIVSTAGPLLCKDIDPEKIDYDNYFNSEIRTKSGEFELLSKVEYEEMLKKCGFVRQMSQRHLFWMNMVFTAIKMHYLCLEMNI